MTSHAFACACGDSFPSAPMRNQHYAAHFGEPGHFDVAPGGEPETALCGATQGKFTCNLPAGHDRHHEDRHPSGGCVGWPPDEASGEPETFTPLSEAEREMERAFCRRILDGRAGPPRTPEGAGLRREWARVGMRWDATVTALESRLATAEQALTTLRGIARRAVTCPCGSGASCDEVDALRDMLDVLDDSCAATEGHPEASDLASDRSWSTPLSPDAVSTSALRPDETPRSGA
jgi:hypothetical protein